jgi:hypothetical protein
MTGTAAAWTDNWGRHHCSFVDPLSEGTCDDSQSTQMLARGSDHSWIEHRPANNPTKYICCCTPSTLGDTDSRIAVGGSAITVTCPLGWVNGGVCTDCTAVVNAASDATYKCAFAITSRVSGCSPGYGIDGSGDADTCIVCDRDPNDTDRCVKIGGGWIAGQWNQKCTTTCANNGANTECNANRMSLLTSYGKMRRAFQYTGYSCSTNEGAWPLGTGVNYIDHVGTWRCAHLSSDAEGKCDDVNANGNSWVEQTHGGGHRLYRRYICCCTPTGTLGDTDSRIAVGGSAMTDIYCPVN